MLTALQYLIQDLPPDIHRGVPFLLLSICFLGLALESLMMARKAPQTGDN